MICDELGTLAETEQLLQAVNCGVLLYRLHPFGQLGGTVSPPAVSAAAKEKAFEKVLLLRGADLPGQAAGIFKIEDRERQVKG